MPKNRPEETPEQRKSRKEKIATERSDASVAAEEAVEAMVKRSIDEHGA
jgi:hypothetical protein